MITLEELRKKFKHQDNTTPQQRLDLKRIKPKRYILDILKYKKSNAKRALIRMNIPENRYDLEDYNSNDNILDFPEITRIRFSRKADLILFKLFWDQESYIPKPIKLEIGQTWIYYIAVYSYYDPYAYDGYDDKLVFRTIKNILDIPEYGKAVVFTSDRYQTKVITVKSFKGWIRENHACIKPLE